MRTDSCHYMDARLIFLADTEESKEPWCVVEDNWCLAEDFSSCQVARDHEGISTTGDSNGTS